MTPQHAAHQFNTGQRYVGPGGVGDRGFFGKEGGFNVDDQ